MTTRFVGLKEFRANIAKITQDAIKRHQTVIILKKNRPICELTPLVGDEEGIYRPEFVRGILEAERQIKKGQVYTSAQVRKYLGLQSKKARS